MPNPSDGDGRSSWLGRLKLRVFFVLSFLSGCAKSPKKTSCIFIKSVMLVIYPVLMLGKFGLSAAGILALRMGSTEAAQFIVLGSRVVLFLITNQTSKLQDASKKTTKRPARFRV